MKTFGAIAVFLIPCFATADYSLTIATESPAVRQDNFIVSGSVSNISDESGWIDFGDRESDYEIDLRDAASARVPESAYSRRIKAQGPFGSTRLVPFPPHAARSVKIDIARFFHIPGPGTYTVELSRLGLRSNLLVVTLIPGIASVPGPSAHAAAPPVITSSGGAQDSFSLHIEVDRSTVFSGKEIPVYAVLTNLSAATLATNLSSNDSRFGIDVRDEHGRAVAETELGKLRRETEARYLETAHRFKMTPKLRFYGGVNIAQYINMEVPGDYWVQLYWAVPADLGGGEIRSNMLRVTVQPSGSK